jgi:hypothetical protein
MGTFDAMVVRVLGDGVEFLVIVLEAFAGLDFIFAAFLHKQFLPVF